MWRWFETNGSSSSVHHQQQPAALKSWNEPVASHQLWAPRGGSGGAEAATVVKHTLHEGSRWFIISTNAACFLPERDGGRQFTASRKLNLLNGEMWEFYANGRLSLKYPDDSSETQLLINTTKNVCSRFAASVRFIQTFYHHPAARTRAKGCGYYYIHKISIITNHIKI